MIMGQMHLVGHSNILDRCPWLDKSPWLHKTSYWADVPGWSRPHDVQKPPVGQIPILDRNHWLDNIGQRPIDKPLMGRSAWLDQAPCWTKYHDGLSLDWTKPCVGQKPQARQCPLLDQAP